MVRGVNLEDLDEPSLERLAAKLARNLRPGDAVVLSGEVGAGKTTFVRSAARSLGVRERVTSPTYQIARSYEGGIGEGRIPVNHLDLYRLDGLGAYDALDIEEYLTPEAITFIEWADPALEIIEEPTIINISHQTPSTRRVEISGPLAERIGE
ncbi:MAG: tRNA (adenosine(37)-N6)-threonylcarbamoyltransferase complex ATPase subunit type 1 TsaE [Rubrobacter sp.]|nr:tRNA (adenosine(37)-N6)-threonylcarbamoyltransferase complex ATPase subunit type 1 TsaE [Rubrobacter sp.]